MTRIPAPHDAANDQVYTLAASFVVKEGKCSTSAIQREFGIGYNRAARIVERLELMGIVSPADDKGKRTVVTPTQMRDAIEVGKAAQALRDMGASVEIRSCYQTIARIEPTPILSEVEKSARRGRAPMKKDPDFMAHNEQAYNVTADELRQFIERIEQVAAEIADMREGMKDVFAEAKGRGYDTKCIRKLVALRKRKPDDIAEEEAILDMYKTALGMA